MEIGTEEGKKSKLGADKVFNLKYFQKISWMISR